MLVTTYNREDALDLVLRSVYRQTRLPDEIVIADDGSGPATRRLVEQHAARAPFPIRHVWQQDKGFRAARCRNRAIAATDADYVIMIDGDMVLHPLFVADHAAAARPRRFAQGYRVSLSPEATAEALRTRCLDPRKLAKGRVSPWRFTVRNRLASRLSGWFGMSPRICQSCNQAFWRRDLVRVNGFDERMLGWGREDDEICKRLIHGGVKRLRMMFRALGYHLHHEPQSLDRLEVNTRLLVETMRTKRTRCRNGLDRHGGQQVDPGAAPGDPSAKRT